LSEKYGQTSCFDYICRKKKNLNRMFYKNEYYVYVYNFEIFLSAIKHTRTLSTIRLSVSQTFVCAERYSENKQRDFVINESSTAVARIFHSYLYFRSGVNTWSKLVNIASYSALDQLFSNFFYVSIYWGKEKRKISVHI